MSLRNLTRAWWNFGGNVWAFITLHAFFFCAIFAFQTPIPERYLNTISALQFTLLSGPLCPPFSCTCNCVSLLRFSCQRSNWCARSHGSTYAGHASAQTHDTRRHWNHNWRARWHAHMAICPYIHRGMSESPQGKGRGQKADYKQGVV